MDTYGMSTYGMGTYGMVAYGMVTYCMGTRTNGYQDCTATAWTTLFLVLSCQENITQGGLVTARGGFHKWKEIQFNKILFCRILLLVTQFMAPPVAVTQLHVVCPLTAQWLPVNARWLPFACQMTAQPLLGNCDCTATEQQLHGDFPASGSP